MITASKNLLQKNLRNLKQCTTDSKQWNRSTEFMLALSGFALQLFISSIATPLSMNSWYRFFPFQRTDQLNDIRFNKI